MREVRRLDDQPWVRGCRMVPDYEVSKMDMMCMKQTHLFLNAFSEPGDSNVLALLKFRQTHLHDLVVQSIISLTTVSVAATIARHSCKNIADSHVRDTLDDCPGLPVVGIHGAETKVGWFNGSAAKLGKLRSDLGGKGIIAILLGQVDGKLCLVLGQVDCLRS